MWIRMLQSMWNGMKVWIRMLHVNSNGAWTVKRGPGYTSWTHLKATGYGKTSGMPMHKCPLLRLQFFFGGFEHKYDSPGLGSVRWTCYCTCNTIIKASSCRIKSHLMRALRNMYNRQTCWILTEETSGGCHIPSYTFFSSVESRSCSSCCPDTLAV